MKNPHSYLKFQTRKMLESAILVAIALALNEFAAFKARWAFGGSVTMGSMLPVILIAWRWGTCQGLFSALVFALLQLFLGFQNVTYGQNLLQMLAIALLDYVVAYTVLGLGGVFRHKAKNQPVALGAGILLVSFLRFVCHFFSGWMIWDALWPNAAGLSSPLYSLVYNGGYMLPEALIALAIGLVSFPPLRRFWLGEDLPEGAQR